MVQSLNRFLTPVIVLTHGLFYAGFLIGSLLYVVGVR